MSRKKKERNFDHCNLFLLFIHLVSELVGHFWKSKIAQKNPEVRYGKRHGIERIYFDQQCIYSCGYLLKSGFLAKPRLLKFIIFLIILSTAQRCLGICKIPVDYIKFNNTAAIQLDPRLALNL